ncbi:MAG TPA: GntP family permease [Candidatus Corynebacterium gallistercoris]|uniref:GntP family permease n=1 Tax=Candidatus Corynebacterium gallistercoris TaxID=2838530 RepID=A0A9D1RW63_9CORY|nr:GntP family permease [Candidatus Corynebacterium gallistercoris]
MTALPGTPQIQNVIPGQFFGTSTYAAPVIGIVGSVGIAGLGLAWLEFRKRQLIAAGEHFSHVASTPAVDLLAGSSENADKVLEHTSSKLVPFLPIITVAVVNFVTVEYVLPSMDFSYLAEEKFGGIELKDREALWGVMVAILAAIALILVMNLTHINQLAQSVAEGAKKSVMPIFSVASEVGYGAVVASVAAFALIRDAVFDLGANALVTSVLSTSVTAGMTGSSSGGMTIALNAFGEELKQMAVDEGMSLEIMHRLTAMAAGGIDTLPHSGAVITLLAVCGLTHRQSYKDVGVITLIIPVLVVGSLVAAVSVFG